MFAGSAVESRCQRARGHLDALLSEIEGWTLDIVTFLAPDGMSQATRLYPVDPGAATGWALHLSDVIHSARAALDNTAYALAVAHSGVLTPDQAGSVAFSVRTSELAYRKKGPQKAVALLSPAAQAAVEAAQPWQTAAPRSHPLAALVALSNTDKHRQLNVVTSSATGAHLPMLKEVPYVDTTGMHLGPITDGFELYTVKFKEPQTEPLQHATDFAAVHWVDEPDVEREGLRTLAARMVDHVTALTADLLDAHL